MFKNFSIRHRLTVLSACLLTLTCIGLTFFLNLNAFKAMDIIDATAITLPAIEGIENAAEMTPATLTSETKRGFSMQSLFTMISFILGGTALTYVVTGRALQPLDVLNEQIKNMSINNLEEPLAIPNTHDEIAEITHSFNAMSQQINAAYLSQKRFASNAAHELKTPLSILQTKVDVFKKKTQPSMDEYQALVTVFENQIIRLRELVNRLLDMSISTDALQISTFDLKELFQEIILELTVLANAKAITISLDSDHYQIQGDIDLLYRAFYNLVENAIKYNNPKGKVDITIKALPNKQIQIQISDQGYGIPIEHSELIFEPFYRIDESRSRNEGGSGLGLALVREIITKHHGEIHLNKADATHTCFEVRLPLCDN